MKDVFPNMLREISQKTSGVVFLDAINVVDREMDNEMSLEVKGEMRGQGTVGTIDFGAL
jgi:hypothetical protein